MSCIWLPSAKCKTSPEPIGWRCLCIGRGRIEDEVKPFLRLREALIIAKMDRDHYWDMVDELPVVIGIRPTGTDVDLLVLQSDLDRAKKTAGCNLVS